MSSFMILSLLMFLPGPSAIPTVLAYLDPGTGSMVLQILIAGGLSGLFFLRNSWASVRCWFSRDRCVR